MKLGFCGCEIFDSNEIRTQNSLVRKQTLNHLAKLVKWLSCVVSTYLYGAFDGMYYYVTYAIQSESTHYSCLNVKEIFDWNRRNISSLSDSNGIQTHHHLVHKWTLNHLAKLAKCWAVLWVLICTVHLTVCVIQIQMHCTDKYSQHNSIICPVCLNGWVLAYKLIGWGFEFRYSEIFIFQFQYAKRYNFFTHFIHGNNIFINFLFW